MNLKINLQNLFMKDIINCYYKKHVIDNVI
jgi:hypothetical protein